MSYTAVVQARSIANSKLDTLRAAIKLSEERARKSGASAKTPQKDSKK